MGKESPTFPRVAAASTSGSRNPKIVANLLELLDPEDVLGFHSKMRNMYR
jgi:hypothetical protein